jgi:hypothetical protein
MPSVNIRQFSAQNATTTTLLNPGTNFCADKKIGLDKEAPNYIAM